MDITVDGREIKAVAIVSKQAFTYVFDRVTGEPVWPIEERPVPPSPVPGERLAATQPFPTKPPAFDLQGVSLDDLVDFTPELRQEAIELLDQWVWGPMFTPPSTLDPRPGGTKGTFISPGTAGGASWTGAGVDPDTGVLYVPSFYGQNVLGITRSEHPRSNVRFVRERFTYPPGPQGLPLFKPPYGRLTAIDLNTGEFPLADTERRGPPRPSSHPPSRPAVARPKRAFVGAGHQVVHLPGRRHQHRHRRTAPPWGGVGDKKFRAYDKQTGEVMWEIELPGGTSDAPMTYMVDGTQYIVVAVGWENMPAEWVALALP